MIKSSRGVIILICRYRYLKGVILYITKKRILKKDMWCFVTYKINMIEDLCRRHSRFQQGDCNLTQDFKWYYSRYTGNISNVY